jgi:hypothetical protein
MVPLGIASIKSCIPGSCKSSPSSTSTSSSWVASVACRVLDIEEATDGFPLSVKEESTGGVVVRFPLVLDIKIEAIDWAVDVVATTGCGTSVGNSDCGFFSSFSFGAAAVAYLSVGMTAGSTG